MSAKADVFELMDREAIGNYFPEILEALSYTADGKYVFLNNLDEDYSYWSPQAVEYFGLPGVLMKEAGPIWMHHVAPQDREEYMKQIDDLFTGRIDEHDMVYRAMNKEGHYVTCSCRGRVIRKEDGSPKFFAGTIVNHELGKNVDPVTGLYNRAYLMSTMQNLLIQEKPFYMVMVGLRNFFDINSAYGYKFGNSVLKNIAEEAVGFRSEGMLFRAEGTKFVYIIDAADETKEHICEEFVNMRNFLENNLIVEGNHLTVDICGSLMKVDDFTVDVNSIYNSALFVMQKAKDENTQKMIVVDEDYFIGNEKHLKLLSDIRNSISENYRGFVLYYQPIMDAISEEITGMEALIRWQDEQGRIVPPGEFIPWLERDPIYYDLGAWIIRTAVRDTKKLVEMQPSFSVNVNLAYPQLQRSELKDLIENILMEEGFPVENIKLELTERCKLLDQDELRNAMIYFKASGMQTALDDFGTGYSALNLMAELPVDSIKIDKTFVDNIETDIPKQSILRAITSCARELGKKVCVEGIETHKMAEFIRMHFPVTNFQGYYFSKPVPIDDFMVYYYNHNRRLEAEQEREKVLNIMR